MTYPHNTKLAGFVDLDERNLWICQQRSFGRSVKDIAAEIDVTPATVYSVTWMNGPNWATGSRAELAWKPVWDSPDEWVAPDNSGWESCLSPIPPRYRPRALRALMAIRDECMALSEAK